MMSDPIYAPDWTARALCAQIDPSPWFVEKGGSSKEAVAVCNRCPVIEPCLQMALTFGERHGIWGGLSERQRRGMEAA